MDLDLALGDIWVYLSVSPLLHLTLTVLAYLVGDWVFRRSGKKALLNPVLLSILLLVVILGATGTDYQTYFAGAQFVHFMLGPATVALAVPLYRNLGRIRRLWLPILVSIAAGAVVSATSAVFVARWLGASEKALISLAPKSVTAPVAMGIAEKVGGLPSLSAALVVLTGVLGAVIGGAVLTSAVMRAMIRKRSRSWVGACSNPSGSSTRRSCFRGRRDHGSGSVTRRFTAR
jgi:putative effector of murein hydrolase